MGAQDGGLAGRAVVVVGASAGIGRALAVATAARGARVVAAARRADRLDELTAIGDVTPVVADVRDPASCADLADRAAEVLGSIDLLCYCVGLAPLRMVAETTAAEWGEVLATNVIGANQVIRAALEHLAPSAVVLALSSETVDRPRPALGAYGASKAALSASLEAWRTEHPWLRFCCVAVGPTFPTEFGDGFDPDLLVPALDAWAARGLAHQEMMATDDLAAVLADTVASLVGVPGVSLDHLTARSPSPVVGTGSELAASARRWIDDDRPL
jgi:NAD(P)-dependent dehydrogenase (short-subunit alcohol dehydrogenase family)